MDRIFVYVVTYNENNLVGVATDFQAAVRLIKSHNDNFITFLNDIPYRIAKTELSGIGFEEYRVVYVEDVDKLELF